GAMTWRSPELMLATGLELEAEPRHSKGRRRRRSRLEPGRSNSPAECEPRSHRCHSPVAAGRSCRPAASLRRVGWPRPHADMALGFGLRRGCVAAGASIANCDEG